MPHIRPPIRGSSILKAYQPRQKPEFLQVVYETQTTLAEAGLPCPAPIINPAAIGAGYATVEELKEDG